MWTTQILRSGKLLVTFLLSVFSFCFGNLYLLSNDNVSLANEHGKYLFYVLHIDFVVICYYT